MLKRSSAIERTTATQSSHPYGAKEICRQVGISHRQLDYWVLIGVIKPYLEQHGAKLFRRFSQQDLLLLRRIKQLTDEGVVISRAAERVRRELAANATADPGTHPTAQAGASSTNGPNGEGPAHPDHSDDPSAGEPSDGH
jgi:DNA-binding transcriptional MerR regulator